MACRVVKQIELPDGEPAWEAVCDSHGDKVQLLADLAERDALRPEIRRGAELIMSAIWVPRVEFTPEKGYGVMPGPALDGYKVQRWTQNHIRFVPELRETFTDAVTMLRIRMGDCDDHARLVYALLRSLGHTMAMATLGNPPIHVAAVIQDRGTWRWLETTVAALVGEHPVAAARRLGVRVRPDLAG